MPHRDAQLGAAELAEQGAGFPRESLVAGERILFEVKPSFAPFLLAPLAALSLLLLTGLVFFIAFARLSVESAAVLCGGPMVIILPLIGLGGVVGFYRWRATIYAVTDRRVVVKTGLVGTSITDAPHSSVQNVTMVQNGFQKLLGYGTVVFSTSGIGGGAAMPTSPAGRTSSNLFGAGMLAAGGGIVFFGVRDPIGLRRRCQELMEQSMEDAKTRDYRKMADTFAQRGPAASPTPRLVVAQPAPPRSAAKFCEFCGSRIEGTPTFCPRCGGRVN